MKLKLIFSIKSLLIILFSTFNNIYSQCNYNQLGTEIYGDEQNENLGAKTTLSSDGNTFAVSSPSYSSGGINRGYVKVYKIDSTGNQLKGNVIYGISDDQIGYSISLNFDGRILAIGSISHNSGKGFVKVYKFINNNWIQLGDSIPGENYGDWFGYSVSLSFDGATLAIGSTNNNSKGQVKIFRYINSNWVQKGPNIEGESTSENFGFSVSLSSDGNIVGVGAPFYSNKGIVRIYKFTSNSWSQTGQSINGLNNNDEFGRSISINSDGNVIAIGSYKNSGGGILRGQTRVYKNINNTWTLLGDDINGEYDYDYSSYTIGLSSNAQFVVIGSRNNSNSGAQRGQTRIYKLQNNKWIKIGQSINGKFNSERSGWSVSIDQDGKTIVIGAPFNSSVVNTAGCARVYKLECKYPKISIKGNEKNIINGDTIVSILDSTYFGKVINNTQRRFKIINKGDDTLKIKSIKSLGQQSSEFQLSNITDFILPNDSSLFNVTFNSSNLSLRTCLIEILTNIETFDSVFIFKISAEKIVTSALNIEKTFEIEISPNPFYNFINIIPNSNKLKSIELYDLNGNNLSNLEINNNKVTLDLSFLNKGIYFLKLNFEESIVYKKVIKL